LPKPPATALTVAPDGSSDATGAVAVAVVPVPSWPRLFRPKPTATPLGAAVTTWPPDNAPVLAWWIPSPPKVAVMASVPTGRVEVEQVATYVVPARTTWAVLQPGMATPLEVKATVPAALAGLTVAVNVTA
jgi:hypothetical protein